MRRTYFFMIFLTLFIGLNSCNKDNLNALTENPKAAASLKEAFDRQYSNSGFKSAERSFNNNFRSQLLWNTVRFRNADTAILRVKLLDDVKIYTNDAVPVDMTDNLIVKASRKASGDWEFVKVIYLPETGKDTPEAFTGRIISEGYFDDNFMVAKFYAGQGFYALFNAENNWLKGKTGSRLKASNGDDACNPRGDDQDGGTVTGYVDGQVNTVWRRPKKPKGPRLACTDDYPSESGGGGGGAGGPQDNQPAIKMQDLPPAKFDWRLKLKTTEDFMKYLPKVEGIIKTNPDGTTMLDEDLKGVPNPDAYNCHYYSFGENKDPNSFDPKNPKVIDFPDLSKFKGLSPGDKVRVGDRVLYVGWPDSGTKLVLHSGIVTQVDANGYATEISSKMGDAYGIIKHHPRDIPESYGLSEPATQFPDGQLRYNREYYRPTE